MRKKISKAFRWFVNRLPEAFLVLFLCSLAPLVYLVVRALGEQWRVARVDWGAYLGSLKSNSWPLLGALLCIVGTALVAFMLLRWRSPIWAVARKMIIEAMHRRVVVVLLVFFLVLMPSLPFILKTEGNLKSQVQIIFTYALTLAKVLLSLLAIFLATASICSEIERQQVHVTDSKPLHRWQFLVGKLLGIVVMCCALLFVMSGAALGLVRYMTRERQYPGLDEREARLKEEQRQKVFHEVFVARSSRKPSPPDVSGRVETELKRLEEGDLKRLGGPEQARRILTLRLTQWALSVPPRSKKHWIVRGLKPPSETEKGRIYLRFKLFAPGAGDLVAGRWTVWRPMPGQEKEQGTGPVKFIPLYPIRGRCKPGTYQELPLPASAVNEDGSLHISYTNLEPRNTVAFALEDGLEVLQKTEGFLPNYYRSLMVIMFHVVLLAALGLMAGSVFSFPVASLLVVFIFGLGIGGPWFLALMRSVSSAFRIEDNPRLGHLLNWLVDGFLRLVFKIVPHFGKYSPLESLVTGRLVGWPFVAEAGAMMVFIKGGIATLIGVFFYARRELARIIA